MIDFPPKIKAKLKRSSIIHKKTHKNYKQIIILSIDALRERKLRSALTILMVVAGGALMVALNAMSTIVHLNLLLITQE